MGLRVYGHWGSPFLVFPTSGGDEWETERMGLLAAIGHHVDAGRVRLFCVGSVNDESWGNDGAHPRHRSYVQAMFDAYISEEVVPFVYDQCQTPGIPITTTGASLGAYHAANSLLKHPALFQRCLALSGVYDLSRYMNGDYDDNFYYNNPVDYVPGLPDSEVAELQKDDIRLVTGTGPWEDRGPAHQLSEVLSARGIGHSVDDWGPEGGHDWPFWTRQMDDYISKLY